MTRPAKHHHQLLIVFICMLSVLRARAFVVTARTFSVSSSPKASKASFARRTAAQPVRSRALASSSSPNNVNGDSDTDEDQDTPTTGWNHNPPSDSSDFWKPFGEKSAVVDSDEASSRSELPTGWLHNAKSPEEAQAVDTSKKAGGFEARERLVLAMKQQERNHRIVSPPTFHECGEGRAIVVTEHRISLPLTRPDKSPRVDVAFTIVEKVNSRAARLWFEGLLRRSPQQRASDYVQRAGLENADKMVLYLQGGPGFGAPTPIVSLGISDGGSWAASALDTYSRVVLMDQRGTGQSTPITKQTLERKFPDLFLLDGEKGGALNDFEASHPEEAGRVKTAVGGATDYLAQFRADNIVRDAEEIREALLLPTKSEEPRPWGCALGQSFGGFCMMTYLSQVERPPSICLFTGGISPMLTKTDDAYRSLWSKVQERSLLFYDQYPGDVTLVNIIVQKLLEQPATLPSGGKLTARRFLQLGLSLGGSPSSFASMHALFSSAFLETGAGADLAFSRAFLKQMESEQCFDDNPLYFWLHESIYCDGPEHSPTNWSAHRVYEDLSSTRSEFDYKVTSSTSSANSDQRPTLFSGEMVFPWMSEDYAELQGVGLTAMAEALATKTDWSPLYDSDHMRKVLSDGTSRAAAAVYYGDMYVDFDSCAKVTARDGPLENCKVWVTNDYQHSGLRDAGASIFKKLLGMANGSIRTPS